MEIFCAFTGRHTSVASWRRATKARRAGRPDGPAAALYADAPRAGRPDDLQHVYELLPEDGTPRTTGELREVIGVTQGRMTTLARMAPKHGIDVVKRGGRQGSLWSRADG